ncbi:branched-chain amino acid ABC transporter ATP-binding protein/permease [Leucobacter sp. USHLN153]|uniref:branched-chain amino acid ABC transporter ATP-binding protein/permease n=1 Tax=Leucobacter sp. USHLN153 TaxID=3081268 RepID=UPI00301879C7
MRRAERGGKARAGLGSRTAVLDRAGWALLAVLLVVAGLTLPVYWVYLLTTVAITALVARGIGLVTGRAGLISLCQMSFAAIGGWVVSAVALDQPDAPFPLLVLLGGVAAAPIGWLLGLATTRVRGVEFAVVTLGFAAALDLVLRQGSFPGVGSGTPVLPAAPFDDARWYFALAWALLLLLQLTLRAGERSVHGLGWSAVRSSERGAAALGVRVGAAKASAFALGALCSGVAGGLLAGQYGLLTPQVFSPLTSLVTLATAVLCGAALFGGAVLAGVFAVFVPEVLRRLGMPLDVGNALLAIGAFDVLRRGNGGIVEQLRARLEERAFARSRRSCEWPALERTDDAPQGADAAHGGSVSAAPDDPDARERANGASPLLAVRNLTVSYGGTVALNGVDLTVRAGEVHALIGPNGAGKSTLIDVVTGFTGSASGEVQLDGIDLDGRSARVRSRRGIRRTFQHVRAPETLTVGEYLRLAAGGRAAGMRDPGAPMLRAERSQAVRAFLGLPGDRVPIRLMDAGSRRVLEVAGALVSAPRVALLDEPAAGLGAAESRALAERIREIPERFGCAVLLVEHDIEFVRATASRVTVLDDGRVIGSGPVAEVLSAPKVIAAYLGTERSA